MLRICQLISVLQSQYSQLKPYKQVATYPLSCLLSLLSDAILDSSSILVSPRTLAAVTVTARGSVREDDAKENSLVHRRLSNKLAWLSASRLCESLPAPALWHKSVEPQRLLPSSMVDGRLSQDTVRQTAASAPQVAMFTTLIWTAGGLTKCSAVVSMPLSVRSLLLDTAATPFRASDGIIWLAMPSESGRSTAPVSTPLSVDGAVVSSRIAVTDTGSHGCQRLFGIFVWIPRADWTLSILSIDWLRLVREGRTERR